MKSLAANDSSPFNRLPDEIVLQILNKLIDLKILCFCHLVSKRFSSIVLEVDTISFTTPLMKPPSNYVCSNCHSRFPSALASFECKSFRSAVKSLKKFTRVKSLCIQLRYSPNPNPNPNEGVDNNSISLFKWKIKFGNKVESYLFLSPNSIYDTNSKELLYVNGNGQEEEDMDLNWKKYLISMDCMDDAIMWYMILSECTTDLLLLEKVSITDSDRSGRISLSGGEKIGELSNWIMRFPSEQRLSRCHVLVLELPVSGYVMKGVTLVLVERDGLPDYFIE